MSFEPRGFFQSTREKEYESYCAAVEDAIAILDDMMVLTPTMISQLINLTTEAADDFTD